MLYQATANPNVIIKSAVDVSRSGSFFLHLEILVFENE
jgi:hypothetical protein